MREGGKGGVRIYPPTMHLIKQFKVDPSKKMHLMKFSIAKGFKFLKPSPNSHLQQLNSNPVAL